MFTKVRSEKVLNIHLPLYNGNNKLCLNSCRENHDNLELCIRRFGDTVLHYSGYRVRMMYKTISPNHRRSSSKLSKWSTQQLYRFVVAIVSNIKAYVRYC